MIKKLALLISAIGILSVLNPISAQALPTTPQITTIAVDVTTGGTMTVKVIFSDASVSTNAGYRYSTDNGSTWKECDSVDCTWTSHQSYLILKKLSNANAAMSLGSTYSVAIKGCASGTARNSGNLGLTSCGASSTSFVYVAGTPDAPNLTGITAGSQTLTVTFTAPANDGGSAITKYQYSTDGVHWCDRDNPSATDLTSPIIITKVSTDCSTLLSNGTRYTIYLRALNTSGNGVSSASISGTPSGGGVTYYYVTYNANGGSGEPTDSLSYVSGDSATVKSAGSMSNPGSTFNHWSTSSTDSGTSYSAGDTFTLTADRTLYAIWTVNPVTTYSVTYNANNGVNPPTDSNSYVSGDEATVSGKGSMTYSGYTFSRWNTNADDTGTAYAAGDTFTVTANRTLYAIWTADPTPNPTPAPPAPCFIPKITSALSNGSALDKEYFYAEGSFEIKITSTNAKYFEIKGSLPAGMVLDQNTGTISGTPKKDGIFTFTIVAKTDCGEDAFPITLDIDKETPNAISCRFNFGNSTNFLNTVGMANLIKCVQKAKDLSPKKITPTIIFTGGMIPTTSDPTGCDTATERYQSILDAIMALDLDPQLAESLFDGAGNQVEIVFIWIRPGN